MKRLSPGHELLVNNPALLVRLQLAVFEGKLFPEFFKTLLHHFRGCRRIGVVEGHFVKAAVEEFPLEGGGGGVRQKALRGLDFKHPQSGLRPGNENVKIQRMFGSPYYQFLRSISPVQPERRRDDLLCAEAANRVSGDNGGQKKRGFAAWLCGKNAHGGIIPRGGGFRKPRRVRRVRRGFALVEATMAMSLLSVTGLLLLKLSLNVVHPRQHTLQQVLSDSYLTFERARAERIPFSNLVANDSPWPSFPTVASETVQIGRLPGGVAVNGTVSRTRIPAAENYPIDGGTGTVAINPAAMKVWRVQSILRYQISGRTYVKSRTMVRAQ